VLAEFLRLNSNGNEDEQGVGAHRQSWFAQLCTTFNQPYVTATSADAAHLKTEFRGLSRKLERNRTKTLPLKEGSYDRYTAL
jgi:hypothetical protein